jgi:hypothetical protein
MAFAGRYQSKVPTLRPPWMQRCAASTPRKISRERRTSSHRIDAGLFARRLNEAGAIAGREYVGIVGNLER